MNHGICVRYDYEGDETTWSEQIKAFIDAVDADTDLNGKFTYHVQTAKNGSGRVHIGRWDAPETVQLLQSRPYFKAFATYLQGIAGDSLSTMPFDLVQHTRN